MEKSGVMKLRHKVYVQLKSEGKYADKALLLFTMYRLPFGYALVVFSERSSSCRFMVIRCKWIELVKRLNNGD